MKKILLSIIASVAVSTGYCQEFPTQPVKIITSLPVGSGPDTLLRQVSDQLSKKWKVPVIIDNRPGGAGGVGLAAYTQSPADGHTIYFSDSSVVISYPILYNNPDSIKSIKPLVPVTQNYMMLFSSVNTSNFADLKSKILKNSSFGSWGVGSAGHLAGLELNDFLNVQQIHVPYKNFNQWFVDVGNQDVTYGYATIASSVKMVQANKIKYVAYLGSSRHPDFPGVPTLHELTKHNFKYTTAWLAFYIHKDVSLPVSSKLEKDIREVLVSSEIQSAMATMHYRPWNATLVEFEKSVANETNAYRHLTKKHNISVN